MDKERRIFQIPDLDTEEQDVDNPITMCHFLPGKLIKDSTSIKDSKTSEKLSSKPEVSVKHSSIHRLDSDKFFEGDKAACKETSKSKFGAVSKKPVFQSSTKFENTFSNLKTSKYYDEVSAEVNQSKSTDKITKSTSSILVNPRQRGNPLLKNIRNVPWEFEEIEPDYVMGKSTCALFLSMRYHNLFPNYIHERLKALGKSYQLRVLLVQVDVVDPNPPLKDLSIIAILADCTLMVVWNSEEAGSYLETYKMFENKSADLIMEKQGADTYSQLVDCLTTVRSINKTDAMVLLSTFGTLEKIIQASAADLALCSGIGPLKAKRLYDALRKPVKQIRDSK